MSTFIKAIIVGSSDATNGKEENVKNTFSVNVPGF